MPPLRTLVAALMLATGVLGARVQGQDLDDLNGAPAQPAAAAGAPLAVPASEDPPKSAPDIFLLPDENGSLRRVLGFRYEDFFKAWQAENSAHPDAYKPTHTLTALDIDARADAEAARITIRIDVELQAEGWVEVPLGFPSLIVQRSKIEGGSHRDFVTYDGGYAAWFNGAPGDRRTIEIEGRLPVNGNVGEQRLTIDLPAAPKSIVNVTTPKPARVDSLVAALVTSEAAENGRIETRIEGAKDRLSISWGDARESDGRQMTAFEAEIDAVVNVDENRLTYDAFITLHGIGGAVERVRIKLPRGATISSLPPSAGYKITPIATDAPGDSPSIVEVRFDEPGSQPPQVHLIAEQSSAVQGASLRMDAIEVVNAFRQRGAVAVRVSDQLQAHFDQHGRVRQIDSSALPEALLTEAPIAAFETAGSDWNVEVHTQPRQRKISATPEYDLHLGSLGAALDFALDYQVSGGRLFELRIDLRGWELTEKPIESGGAINLAEQHVTRDQVLILPLKSTDAQQLRVRLSLRREAGLGLHDLPLPEVLEAFTLPGDLTVTCDDAWRATAQIEKSVGVSAVEQSLSSPAPAGRPPADAAVPPLQLQTYLPQARLTIDVSQRDQEIAVKSAVNARLDGSMLEAVQQLDYEIRYQPAQQLAATVPEDLLANEGLELLLNGKPLPSSAVDIQPLSAAASDETEDDLRLVVTLAEPTVGSAQLSIRTQLSLTDSQRSGTAPIILPLAVPDQVALSTAVVELTRPDLRFDFENAGTAGPWSRSNARAAANGAAAATAGRVRLEASRPARELALRLQPANTDRPAQLRVEASWAQTWIAGGMRQDRMVYRFNTSGDQLKVALPRGFDQLEVLLDHAVASVDRTEPDAIVVNLPAGNGTSNHTLELRRQTPLTIGSWAKQGIAFPRLEGASAWSPFFWLLVLPPDLAALGTPPGMSAEYRLGWQGMRWGREPTQSQRDLEQWTGAITAPTPGPRTNQYLYSSFDPPASVELIVVRRIWLVVGAGMGALMIGLTWLYTSLARSAAFWLVVCIVAVGTLLMYPEMAIVMVQAIVLGGAFTVLSAVTQWLLADARPSGAKPPAAASSVASLTATQPWVTEPSAGATAAAGSGSSYHASGSTP